MSIKLVAIDLDGTLLRSDHTISEENKEAIAKAKEAGVKVVITTGRPLKATELYLEECHLQEPGDYCITYNGGLIQKNDTGEVLDATQMSADDVKDIHHLLTQLDLPMSAVGMNAIFETPHKEGKPSFYREIQPLLEIKEDVDIKDIPEISKIVSARTVEEIDNKISRIPESFYNRFTIVKSRPVLLEFMPKGVHKANGLKFLSQELNIKPEEMMAIGDMENDYTMIEYAGYGVAMGNGDQRIKDTAQYVTKSNNEHGVAHAIEKFVLN